MLLVKYPAETVAELVQMTMTFGVLYALGSVFLVSLNLLDYCRGFAFACSAADLV
jgi:hypothetical protein